MLDLEGIGQSCSHGVDASLGCMPNALVGVIMGSDSDLAVMQPAVDVLAEFGVPFEVRVVSAHRTPDVLYEYASTAADRGSAA